MLNRKCNTLIEDADLFLAVPLILALRNEHLKMIRHFNMNVFILFAFYLWIILHALHPLITLGAFTHSQLVFLEDSEIPHSPDKKL